MLPEPMSDDRIDSLERRAERLELKTDEHERRLTAGEVSLAKLGEVADGMREDLAEVREAAQATAAAVTELPKKILVAVALIATIVGAIVGAVISVAAAFGAISDSAVDALSGLF